jgi:hypothetical protein
VAFTLRALRAAVRVAALRSVDAARRAPQLASAVAAATAHAPPTELLAAAGGARAAGDMAGVGRDLTDGRDSERDSEPVLWGGRGQLRSPRDAGAAAGRADKAVDQLPTVHDEGGSQTWSLSAAGVSESVSAAEPNGSTATDSQALIDDSFFLSVVSRAERAPAPAAPAPDGAPGGKGAPRSGPHAVAHIDLTRPERQEARYI